METQEQKNEKIEALIKQKLTDCDKSGLVFICQKISTEYGMNYCIGRIKSILLKDKDFTFQNALSQLEAELIEQKLY